MYRSYVSVVVPSSSTNGADATSAPSDAAVSCARKLFVSGPQSVMLDGRRSLPFDSVSTADGTPTTTIGGGPSGDGAQMKAPRKSFASQLVSQMVAVVPDTGLAHLLLIGERAGASVRSLRDEGGISGRVNVRFADSDDIGEVGRKICFVTVLNEAVGLAGIPPSSGSPSTHVAISGQRSVREIRLLISWVSVPATPPMVDLVMVAVSFGRRQQYVIYCPSVSEIIADGGNALCRLSDWRSMGYPGPVGGGPTAARDVVPRHVDAATIPPTLLTFDGPHPGENETAVAEAVMTASLALERFFAQQSSSTVEFDVLRRLLRVASTPEPDTAALDAAKQEIGVLEGHISELEALIEREVNRAKGESLLASIRHLEDLETAVRTAVSGHVDLFDAVCIVKRDYGASAAKINTLRTDNQRLSSSVASCEASLVAKAAALRDRDATIVSLESHRDQLMGELKQQREQHTATIEKVASERRESEKAARLELSTTVARFHAQESAWQKALKAENEKVRFLDAENKRLQAQLAATQGTARIVADTLQAESLMEAAQLDALFDKIKRISPERVPASPSRDSREASEVSEPPVASRTPQLATSSVWLGSAAGSANPPLLQLPHGSATQLPNSFDPSPPQAPLVASSSSVSAATRAHSDTTTGGGWLSFTHTPAKNVAGERSASAASRRTIPGSVTGAILSPDPGFEAQSSLGMMMRPFQVTAPPLVDRPIPAVVADAAALRRPLDQSSFERVPITGRPQSTRFLSF